MQNGVSGSASRGSSLEARPAERPVEDDVALAADAEGERRVHAGAEERLGAAQIRSDAVLGQARRRGVGLLADAGDRREVARDADAPQRVREARAGAASRGAASAAERYPLAGRCGMFSARMNASARLLPPLVAFGLLAAPAAAQDPAATPTTSATPVPTTTVTPAPTPPVPTATPTPTPPARPVDGRLRLQRDRPAPRRRQEDRRQGRDAFASRAACARPSRASAAVVQFRTAQGRQAQGRPVRGRRRASATKVRLRKLGRAQRAGGPQGHRVVRAVKSRAPSGSSVLGPSAAATAPRGALLTLFSRGLDRMQYATRAASTFDARARPRGDGLPQGQRPAALGVADAGHRPRRARRQGRATRSASRRLGQARRGRPLAADPRARRRRQARPRLPHVVGRAGHADRSSAPTASTPRRSGTNSKGMVDSAYFIRGYAIHGYVSVPPYNASHGCLRVPIPDARNIYDWIDLGDKIRVTR